MASQAIQIPLNFWPSQFTKANATWFQIDQTNDLFNPEGVLMPDDVDSRICGSTVIRIPSTINATPNGLVRLTYVPVGATGNVLFIAGGCFASVPGTTSIDPASLTSFTTITDAVAAAFVERTVDISLSGIAAGIIANNYINIAIDRNASSDASDTHEANILVTRLTLIADNNV
jgi:hypothetical protein